MKLSSGVAGAMVLSVVACSTQSRTLRGGQASPAAAVAAVVEEDASVPLSFDEFFVEFFVGGSRSLEPSPKLLASSGRRVRISGFMVHMDLPPANGFYVTKRPLMCDEAGAGTADLPPEAVLVKVVPPSTVDLPFIAGPLEVTGLLQVGREEEPDGTVSRVRLLLTGTPSPLRAHARTEKKIVETGKKPIRGG